LIAAACLAFGLAGCTAVTGERLKEVIAEKRKPEACSCSDEVKVIVIVNGEE
jgi:hypothetical protein